MFTIISANFCIELHINKGIWHPIDIIMLSENINLMSFLTTISI